MLLLLATFVQGEGMNEVFKWKQMDFYNRGDGAHSRPRQPDPSGEHQEKREREKKKNRLSLAVVTNRIFSQRQLCFPAAMVEKSV